MNNATKYAVIVPNVTKADHINIQDFITDSLYRQFIYDGILLEYEKMEDIVGTIELHKTNNNRKALGTINNYILHIDGWKEQYQVFENMPFRDLSHRLNNLPNKQLKWKNATEVMNSRLVEYTV